MTNTTLNLEELLCGVNELVDTLWIVTLGNEKVEIVKDSMTPEREGECLDYTELCQTYIQEYVYPADREMGGDLILEFIAANGG